MIHLAFHINSAIQTADIPFIDKVNTCFVTTDVFKMDNHATNLIGSPKSRIHRTKRFDLRQTHFPCSGDVIHLTAKIDMLTRLGSLKMKVVESDSHVMVHFIANMMKSV